MNIPRVNLHSKGYQIIIIIWIHLKFNFWRQSDRTFAACFTSQHATDLSTLWGEWRRENTPGDKI